MTKKSIRKLVVGAMAGQVCDQLRSHPHDDLVLVEAADAQAAQAHAVDTEIIFCISPELTDDLVRSVPKLRWIQAMTACTDHIEALPSVQGKSKPLLSSARGMHGPQVAEMALLHMLSISRNVVRMVDNQRAARWDRWEQPLLWGKTLVIVGLGVIASALAARCKALGMTVIGVTGP